MRTILRFVRTTFLGGVLFLVPITVLVLLIGKVLAFSGKLLEPLSRRLPVEPIMGVRPRLLLSIVVLVLFCFITGLIARITLARRFVRGLETTLLSNLPGYAYIKDVSESWLGAERQGLYPVVFARVDEYWQFGLQVDCLRNGLIAVYVPDSPSPRSGGVYFLTPDRVVLTDLPLNSMLKCLKCLGAGSNDLLSATLAGSAFAPQMQEKDS